MLKINEYEGKTFEEAKEKALIELNANEKELYIKDEITQTGKLFKSNKHIIKVIEQTELKKYIKELITDLSKLLEVDLNFEVRVTDNIFNIILVSSKNAILIGKEGKTLEALQTIIRQIVKNKTDLNIKINVDIADYKNNKIRNLEREIKKIAREVQKSKIEASLDHMNSFERRAIHNMVDEMEHIKTESVGEGKNRHIVIKYVE